MKLHAPTSPNDEQYSKFSFGININSFYLNPNIIANASQPKPNNDEKGEEKGQKKPQK